MSKLYRVHELAERADVTVKTLHHYDRIGLLKPRRTDAGYRLYALDDLARLEHIAALKHVYRPSSRKFPFKYGVNRSFSRQMNSISSSSTISRWFTLTVNGFV